MTDEDLNSIEDRVQEAKKNADYVQVAKAKAGMLWVVRDFERLIAEVRGLKAALLGENAVEFVYRSATNAEREACAKIADSMEGDTGIAAAIRARGIS